MAFEGLDTLLCFSIKESQEINCKLIKEGLLELCFAYNISLSFSFITFLFQILHIFFSSHLLLSDHFSLSSTPLSTVKDSMNLIRYKSVLPPQRSTLGMTPMTQDKSTMHGAIVVYRDTHHQTYPGRQTGRVYCFYFCLVFTACICIHFLSPRLPNSFTSTNCVVLHVLAN